jgi:hypothetical protein
MFRRASVAQPGRRGEGQARADHSTRDDRAEADAQTDRAVSRAESQAQHDFPPEYEYLKVGSPVRHRQFGRGRVLAIRQPWPDTRAEILFESAGKKTLVLSKTTLEVGE